MNIVAQSRRSNLGGTGTKFIKFVMMGSAFTESDINYLLDAVAYYGNRVQLTAEDSVQTYIQLRSPIVLIHLGVRHIIHPLDHCSANVKMEYLRYI